MGQRIKIYRIKANMTQETLAYKSGITPSHCSNIETGTTKVSLNTLVSIANALSVSIDNLLCDSVLSSKVIFEGEAKDIFNDCDDYEIRVLCKILKTSKDAIRDAKILRSSIESEF